MAEATGKATTSDEQLTLLSQHAPLVAFFHVVHALERLLGQAPKVGGEGPASRERLRLRPSISLACPPADVESIEPAGEDRVVVTTTFGGLYGVDSPLPYIYSEHLAQYAHEPRGLRVRAFLDIFHHRLLSLLYRAWKKSRPVTGFTSQGTHELIERVLSVTGRSRKLSEAPMRVLRARTAEGLEALLKLRLGYACSVLPLERRRATIPRDQRTSVGRQAAVLGGQMVIGARVTDDNRIGLHVQADSYDTYARLLPGGPDRIQIDETLASFLHHPVDYYLSVSLPAEQVPRWTLGRLGGLARDSWLGPPRTTARCSWLGR